MIKLNENVLTDERIVARRANFHKCLDLAFDWVSLITAGPAEKVSADMVLVDTTLLRMAMVKYVGEELTEQHFNNAMLNVQHEILNLDEDRKLTLCESWNWAHELFHMLYS